MTKAIVTYEKAVTAIRALMLNWLESGVDLFLKLKEVDESGVWKQPGHATFKDFLRAEFPTALGIERYQNVINAINVYGHDWVRKVGVHSCHVLTVNAVVKDASKRELVRRSVDEFMKENQCAPDANKVRDIVYGVVPEAKSPPKEVRAVIEEPSVRAALKAAKEEIRGLKKELTAQTRLARSLEKENTRLKKAGHKTRRKGGERPTARA